MPFSRENRRFTMIIIAVLLVSLMGVVAFAYLSNRDPDRTALYGTVVGGLCTMLIVQFITLFKAGQAAETAGQAAETAESGQRAARESRATIHAKLNTIEQTAQAGTADKVAGEVQKTIGQQLLADDSFVEAIAEKVASRIQVDVQAVADDAARKALKLYVDAQSAPGRVQT